MIFAENLEKSRKVYYFCLGGMHHQLHIPFKNVYIHLYVYGCFPYMYDCMLQACPMLAYARRGHQISWYLNYGQL